jgi:uncharacterized delta-60 repeat protein
VSGKSDILFTFPRQLTADRTAILALLYLDWPELPKQDKLEKETHMRNNVFSLATTNQATLPKTRASLNPYAKTLLGLALLVSAALALPHPAMAQAGQLDPTFGTGGIFTTNFTEEDTTIAIAVALQSDGKIVVGGAVPNGISQIVGLVRLNTNGSLDTTFGSGGIVSNTFGIEFAQVYGVAILPDGKILAAAEGITGNSIGRFNPNGSVDTTFGVNGFAVSFQVNAAGGPAVLAVQPGGKIIVTGNGVMARYTAGGALDATFGTGGIAPLEGGLATGIALLANGKILITTGSSAPHSVFTIPPALPFPSTGAIARYNLNGSLDTSFGISGQAACVASAAGIALLSGGDFIVAGTITSQLIIGGNVTGFGLVQYNANGGIDTAFGTNGGTITGFPFAAGAFALAIQSNGDIVVAGQAEGSTDSAASLALARYTSAGQLDPTFGSDGEVITTLGASNTVSWVSSLALQSDGKIVAVGNSGTVSGAEFVDNFVVARYLAQ